MSDTVLLTIGAVVFGLMVLGLILTVVEFRRMPRRQKPAFDEVAWQAQPDRPKSKEWSGPRP